MRILRAENHRRMPWKNGGGETVEIAAHPEGSGLSAFGWRISMATVASDGPFSVFPGVDRTLCVLSGDGVELSIEGIGTRVLTPHDTPFSFPADAPTTARLSGGPITDLNVMTRRGLWRHRVETHTIRAETVIATDAQWLVLVCLDGMVTVSAGDGRERLAPRDTVVFLSTQRVTVSADSPTELVVIEIGA